jgi:competence protein ComGC
MEILNTIEEQNKQIISQNEELAKQIKSFIIKPAPVIETRSITENIVNLLKESNKNLKSEIFGLNHKLENIEKNIQAKESFLGFINVNMMIVYFIILLLLCFTNIISCNNNTDNELIAKQNEEINSMKEQIDAFNADNPKIAKKYFSNE